jgi:thioredoxin reductase (NADPH)
MLEGKTESSSVDVLIVGAGPAGLAAGCHCQDCGLSCLVMDRAGLAQSFTEYPDTLRFFSPPDEMEIAGVPLPVAGGEKPTRDTYLAYLRSVVRFRKLPLATWESVVEVVREADGFQVRTRLEPDAGQGRVMHCRRIVAATGLWHEPVRLPAPGYERPNVFAEFHEPTAFFDQDVLVIGGGNSAVGAALSLAEARARVTLSMRRPPRNYRSGLRPFVKRDLAFAVDEGRVTLHAQTVVTTIGGLCSTLQPVRYTGSEDLSEGTAADYEPMGEPFDVPARFVFCLLGHRPDTVFLRGVLGLDLRPDGRPVCDPGTWETSVPGVFVAGSLADHSIDIVLGLRRQAVAAVDSIAQQLEPEL